MSDTVIKVENLGKKYILSHRQEGRSQYRALRDVIADGTKSLGSKILSPFSQQQILSPEKEEFWALKDVSFEIKRGDRVGIIGRNGAGKSTLLKILSRITEPTTGRIQIRGRVASLLEVGTGFHPELTGRENIYLNGAVLGMSKVEIKQKFDEIVDFAEVEKFLDTPVKRYSSGMYVRLAFAVAAHLEPEILVVDEVLAVGDAQFRRKCLGKMGEISKFNHRTVVFVSHDMSAIQSLCNKAAWFENGTIKQIGDSYEISDNYLAYCMIDSYTFGTSKPVGYQATYSGVNTLDSNGKISKTFPCNSSVSIEAYLKTHLRQQVQCGLDIYTIEGTLVTNINSSIVSGRLIELNEGTTKIEWKIPNLNLAPGTYSIHLRLRDSEDGRLIEKIEDAAFFEVTCIDFYNTNNILSHKQGIAFIPFELKISGS